MIKQDIKEKLQSYKRYHFTKDIIDDFLTFLVKKSTVIAPHRKGEKSYSYEKVHNIKDVVIEYPRTIQPLKKYFLPARETLINFNLQDNSFVTPEIKNEKKIFFGIHSYEMQAIKRLDYNFKKGNPESNYLTRRQNSLFIGVSFNPDEFHFSKSVGIDIEETDGFCLFFHIVDDGALVFVIDEDGKKIITEFGKGMAVGDEPLELPDRIFKAKIKYHYNRIPEVFNYVYKSDVWSKVAERCLGCGTCNILCSTCYCFDVRDEIELNVKDGQRERFWDSCMINSFAEVAGGENFREKLGNRTRHRLYRKFKYITDHSNEIQCVGCGRCSAYCPAGISIVEIINDLIKDYSEKEKKYTF